MTTADENRERDIQALLVRLDALEQKKAEPPPFWRNTALVGFMGAVLAIIPPSLTAIQEYFQTQREIALAEKKNSHERTLAYLDRALSLETTEGKQAQVFRFLEALFPDDDPLHAWAAEELGRVEGTIDKLKDEAEQHREEVEKGKQAIDDDIEQVNEAVAKAKDAEEAQPIIQVARLSIAQQEAENARNQHKAEILEQRISGAPSMALPTPTEPAIATVPQWKLRIAITYDLAEALELAKRARKRGAAPEVRKLNSQFLVLVGGYGSRAEALRDRETMRSYLDRPVAVVDVNTWCSTGTMRADYFECDPPM